MEKTTTFSEQLATIQSALKLGDVQRLADEAEVSTTTFRNTFKRASALEMTEAEQRVLNVCNHDRILMERIKQAQRLEEETKRLTNGGK